MDEFTAVMDMTRSSSLRDRVAGCIAGQTPSLVDQPEALAAVHLPRICAEPGWAQAWMSANAAGNPDPGADAGVIPAAWILAAVQKVLGTAVSDQQ